MAVLKRLTNDEINEHFTHYGLFMGLVPVYIANPYGDVCIATRNWIPEWAMDLAEGMHQFCNFNGDSPFMFKITGEIKKDK